MRVTSIFRWHDGELHPRDYCDMTDARVAVADSWYVETGSVLALPLHRERFLRNVLRSHPDLSAEASAVWDASLAAIPRDGQWFPRIELQLASSGARSFVFRLRSAPDRTTRVVVATNPGADPRSQPTVKGPDLDAMLRARTAVQPRGAGEAVILSPEGFVVEGAYSALAWWEHDTMVMPAVELERIDSVTARSVQTLATALGVRVEHRFATPTDLDGREVWSLSALHGIRIVTEWVDGPSVAELPGRLALWRARLDRLRSPLP